MSIEIDSYYPRILIEGVYKGEGSFNDYKLNARGYFNVTFSMISLEFFLYVFTVNYLFFYFQERVSTTVKMNGLFETDNNEQYLHITDFDVLLTMDDMKVFATGIFPEAELSV